MKKSLLFVCGFVCAFSFLSCEKNGGDSDPLLQLRRSVFKIHVVSQEADFANPWRHYSSASSSGTGFYIGNGNILTNAHVVADATFVKIQRDGDASPQPATVSFVGHDCDLAILQVADKSYLKDIAPMKLGKLPALRSPVSTIGYPTGGEQISITDGIVSRVGYRRYVHSGYRKHLLVQVDSAINAGNSGGPVVQGQYAVGVAFQSFTNAENTGYIIPIPVVKRFLKDIEDGKYDGHPVDGVETQKWTVVNPSTAAFHGLQNDKEKPSGIKVSHVAPWAPMAKSLLRGDIILRVDGHEIGVDGKIEFESERVDFRTLYDLKQIGESINYQVVREEKTLDVNIKIAPARPHHVPGNYFGRHPKFVVFGGLVFTTLTRNYLKSWGNKWFKRAPLLLRYLNFYAEYTDESALVEDLIVFSGRLPHPVNTYETKNRYGVVIKVDETRVSSMHQFVNLLEKGKNEFVVIEFWGSDELLVIDRKKALAIRQIISKMYGVVPDRWLESDEKAYKGRKS